MTSNENGREEQWQLGPQDEVGRWVRIIQPSSQFAIHGVVGFHIGGVYGDKEAQERVLAILNELEAARAQAGFDNHHNAYACPYCRPHLEAERAQAGLAQRYEDALRDIIKSPHPGNKYSINRAHDALAAGPTAAAE